LAATGLWLSIRSGVRLEARLGILWVLDVEVFSRILAPSFNARRSSAEPLSRPSDPTGVAVSLGPALSF
jgi:hypothetical protein